MGTQNIASLVRYYRKQSGLSQQALAKLSGVGKTAIFDIEKGKQTVQFNTLLKVLDILNIQLKFEPPFEKKEESNE
jgi:y4mF family transcriptional regulator